MNSLGFLPLSSIKVTARLQRTIKWTLVVPADTAGCSSAVAAVVAAVVVAAAGGGCTSD